MIILYWVLGIILGLVVLQVCFALIYSKFFKPALWKHSWGLAFLGDCTSRIKNGEREIDVVSNELASIRPTLGPLGEILYQECIKSITQPTTRGQLVSLIAKILQTKICLETDMPKELFAEMCITINNEYDVEVKRRLH